MRPREWLPSPPAGTSVCGGFDGSENDDWTGIRLETATGFQFTPRWKHSGEAMIWNPARHGGRIPRLQVHDAWAELAETFRLERVYGDPGFNDPHDPTSWMSELEMWDRLHGPNVFVPWQMGSGTRLRAVHASLVRFETDLRSKALTHDGCPVTSKHVGNAIKVPKPGDRFVLGKPSPSQKIDMAVTSVLCHEAAADALSEGWGAEPTTEYAYFA